VYSRSYIIAEKTRDTGLVIHLSRVGTRLGRKRSIILVVVHRQQRLEATESLAILYWQSHCRYLMKAQRRGLAILVVIADVYRQLKKPSRVKSSDSAV
jgi:hypothetical protein